MLAEQRTQLSQLRTDLAQQRNDLASNRTLRAMARTRLSLQRTHLARGRTYLAMIRTRLAFFVLGLTLFRYFGLSLWTIFDAVLVVVSGLLIGYGIKGHHHSVVGDRRCTELLASDAGLLDLL